MGIQPIDLQIMYSQMSNVSKIASQHQKGAELTNAMQQTKIIQQNSEQVESVQKTASDEAKAINIKKDGRQSQDAMPNGKKDKKKKDDDLPEEKKPSLEEIERVWTSFSSVPQELALPSSPEHPIVVRHEENRPQPRRDRETEKGMACVIGRLRKCPVFDVKFVALSHNTKRGAALGGILNAELLCAKGFFNF